MAKNPVPSENLPPSQTAVVSLPKFLGISPIQYIPVVYGIAILLLFFFIFLFPGLSQPGSWVRVVSDPPGAAVFFGDMAYGSTPCEVFVPSGPARLVLSRRGFQNVEKEVTVGNNLFFSLAFPSRMSIEEKLYSENVFEILAPFSADLSDFSLGSPYEENRQPPPLFTDLKNDLLSAGLSSEEVKNTLLGFLPMLTDFYLYRDFKRALTGDQPQTWQEEEAMWATLLDLEKLPFFRVWLFSTRPLAEKNALLTNPEYWSNIKTKLNPQGRRAVLRQSAVPGFREIPTGVYLFGPDNLTQILTEEPFDYPYLTKLGRVLISSQLITQAEYQRFIRSNPDWSPENRATLVEKGLVGSTYLEDWTGGNPQSPSSPVVNISYQAALAYASSYPSPAGYKARLPYDPEWEALANSALDQPYWEWMSNAFALGDFLLRSESSPWTAAKTGMAHSVRGLPTQNRGRNALYKRGTLPEEWTSPLLGFRLALEPQ